MAARDRKAANLVEGLDFSLRLATADPGLTHGSTGADVTARSDL